MMDRAALLEVLEESRERGLLGPGPVARQYAHSSDLAAAIGPFAGRFLDLGSGGGLPGLVLAEHWPDARGALLDAQQRRCVFLEAAVERLELDQRFEVVCGRAEGLARDPGLRGSFDLVVARSFAAPAVTAECAVAFLRPGGHLVVTEPPNADSAEERWPPTEMAQLGFDEVTAIRHGETGAMRAVLEGEASERWPRREGVPGKRPLW
jgi:16S rRNA (guanine527-N7)-methyltransferase